MTKTQKQIDPDDLIIMDNLVKDRPIRMDLVYADANHPENIFKTRLYKKGAPLLLHRELASVVLAAAEIIHQSQDGVLVLKDGLRPVEAQEAMQDTTIVQQNPQWSAEGPSRLLSPPGSGGHPRGMAVDVTISGSDGKEWDMGTPFDYLTTDPAHNPAARSYTGLPGSVLQNRQTLERAFLEGAQKCGVAILPLPAEWWDFRFLPDYTERFAPVSDRDLPSGKRMIFN